MKICCVLSVVQVSNFTCKTLNTSIHMFTFRLNGLKAVIHVNYSSLSAAAASASLLISPAQFPPRKPSPFIPRGFHVYGSCIHRYTSVCLWSPRNDSPASYHSSPPPGRDFLPFLGHLLPLRRCDVGSGAVCQGFFKPFLLKSRLGLLRLTKEFRTRSLASSGREWGLRNQSTNIAAALDSAERPGCVSDKRRGRSATHTRTWRRPAAVSGETCTARIAVNLKENMLTLTEDLYGALSH